MILLREEPWHPPITGQLAPPRYLSALHRHSDSIDQEHNILISILHMDYKFRPTFTRDTFVGASFTRFRNTLVATDSLLYKSMSLQSLIPAARCFALLNPFALLYFFHSFRARCSVLLFTLIYPYHYEVHRHRRLHRFSRVPRCRPYP